MPFDMEQMIERYQSLKADRGVWSSHWEEVAQFCAPRRQGFTSQQTEGAKQTRKIYDAIGVQCVQTLAAAMHGMCMNPSTKWLKIRIADEDIEEDISVRDYLEQIETMLLGHIQSSTTAFHTHVSQMMEDLASIGTGPVYVGEKPSGGLYFRTYSVADVLIAENRFGTVDTVIRESNMTVRQVVNTWKKKVSKKVMGLYDKGKYDEKVLICHSAMPRDTTLRDITKLDKLNMEFQTTYFEPDTKTELFEGGENELPYVVPRWWVSAGETYGRSPAMSALPDIKMINAATRTMIIAAQKAADPALQVPHDGVVSPVRTTPGGLTVVRGKNEIIAMPTSQTLPFTMEFLEKKKDGIRSSMFVDQVQFVNDTRMTATEVIQRSTERMRLLGPILGRLEAEFLNPLVTRVFNMMARSQMIPRPPDAIMGAETKIEYLSPLSRAQKSQEANALMQAMGILEPFAKIAPQQIIGNINMDKITSSTFDWCGVPADLLLTDKEKQAQQTRSNWLLLAQLAPQLGKAAAGGGAAIADVADAGKSAAETYGQIQQNTVNQAQLPPPGGGGSPGAPGGGANLPVAAGPPPGQGGQNIAELLGSLFRSAQKAAPGIVGNLPDLTRTAAGNRPLK